MCALCFVFVSISCQNLHAQLNLLRFRKNLTCSIVSKGHNWRNLRKNNSVIQDERVRFSCQKQQHNTKVAILDLKTLNYGLLPSHRCFSTRNSLAHSLLLREQKQPQQKKKLNRDFVGAPPCKTSLGTFETSGV